MLFKRKKKKGKSNPFNLKSACLVFLKTNLTGCPDAINVLIGDASLHGQECQNYLTLLYYLKIKTHYTQSQVIL